MWHGPLSRKRSPLILEPWKTGHFPKLFSGRGVTHEHTLKEIWIGARELEQGYNHVVQLEILVQSIPASYRKHLRMQGSCQRGGQCSPSPVTVDLIWLKKTVDVLWFFELYSLICQICWYGDMAGRHIGQGRLQGFLCTLILWIVLVDIPALPGGQRGRGVDCSKDSWIYFVNPLCNTSLWP